MPARAGSLLGGLGRSNTHTTHSRSQDSSLVNPPRSAASPSQSPRLPPQRPPSISLAHPPSMEHIKRHSLSGLVKGHDKKEKKDKKQGSPALRPTIPHNELELSIESPPNVFYGTPERSQGALMSGILRVSILDPELTLETFTGKLYTRVTPKKPTAKDCTACAHKDTPLKSYTFLTEPKTLTHGAHRFPFSHLFSGDLAATTSARLFSITYILEASATTSTGSTLNLHKEILTARSLAVPAEKVATRVFPPTRLQVQLSMPPIVHPIGRWTCNFRLTRVLNPPPQHKTERQTLWKIRRLLWHLEEKETLPTTAIACPKHATKAETSTDPRAKLSEETRTLARQDLNHGFKTDYQSTDPDGERGTIEIEFPIILTQTQAKRALCDISTPSGIKVTHLLTIELIIAEEWVDSLTSPRKSGATGQARVLRTQFGVVISERAGLGISWEDEEPPVYEDVPELTPPDYQGVTGLPPLSEGAREELVRRAREAYKLASVGVQAPSSPPLYGVNSFMDDYTDGPLEEVVQGLNLVDAGQAEADVGRSGVRRGGWRADAEDEAESLATLHPVEAAERERERHERDRDRDREQHATSSRAGNVNGNTGPSDETRESARTEADMVDGADTGVVEDVVG